MFYFRFYRFLLENLLKVGISPSKKNSYYVLPCKPFKNDEKHFYFSLESLFLLKLFKFFS